MVVSHQGGLLSGWSIVRVVFHQLVFHQGGLSPGWSFTRVVFHQGGLTSGVPLYHGQHKNGKTLGYRSCP